MNPLQYPIQFSVDVAGGQRESRPYQSHSGVIMKTPQRYPVRLSVDYPDRALNRVSTFFRLILAIPILLVFSTISLNAWDWTSENGAGAATTGVAGVLFFGPLLMILSRQKYPRWWFDFNLELQRFSIRILANLALMDDRYPSTDDQQSVHLEYDYPDVPHELNRWMPLVKWFLAIPHVIVLCVLNVVAVLAVVGAWFAILVTGRYPRGIFDFVEGVLRWNARVTGYSMTLVTDTYPPFSLAR
jgi:uncharacterized membrane protein